MYKKLFVCNDIKIIGHLNFGLFLFLLRLVRLAVGDGTGETIFRCYRAKACHFILVWDNSLFLRPVSPCDVRYEALL